MWSTVVRGGASWCRQAAGPWHGGGVGGGAVFLGTHPLRLDDKGRLVLPAKHREQLAGGLVITKGQERCLYVFTQAYFAGLAEKLQAAPVTGKTVRDYGRVFFASASDDIPDKQGRVT